MSQPQAGLDRRPHLCQVSSVLENTPTTSEFRVGENTHIKWVQSWKTHPRQVSSGLENTPTLSEFRVGEHTHDKHTSIKLLFHKGATNSCWSYKFELHGPHPCISSLCHSRQITCYWTQSLQTRLALSVTIWSENKISQMIPVCYSWPVFNMLVLWMWSLSWELFFARKSWILYTPVKVQSWKTPSVRLRRFLAEFSQCLL